MWVYALAFSSTFYLIVSAICYFRITNSVATFLFDSLIGLRPALMKVKSENICAGRAYKLCTNEIKPKDYWFSNTDVIKRFMTVQFAFVWVLMTSPISFPFYAFKHNVIWHGKIGGLLLSLFWPVSPLAYLILELIKRI
jgi:hypothetical protein